MDGVIEGRDIGLPLAIRILDAGIAEAERRGFRLSLCVSDRAGTPVGTARMDGSPIGAYTIACDKAFSAAIWRDRTGTMGAITQPGGEDWGINSTFGGRMIVFAGGVPALLDGACIGALGVSGARSHEDEEVALAALAACGLSG